MTWQGGMVPNLAVEGTVIVAGHTVDIATTDTLSLVASRNITIRNGATLVVNGHLSIDGSGTITVDGSLAIGEAGVVSMLDSTVTINGALIVGLGGTLTTATSGQLRLQAGCSASLVGSLSMDDGDLTVADHFATEPGSTVTLAGSASVTVENGGTMHVHGNVAMDGAAVVACGGRLVVEHDAIVSAAGSNDLRALAGGRVDVVGRLTCGSDTTVNIDAGGMFCAWREIICDGSLGIAGQLVMRRREARIRRSDGAALVSVDKTYGYGPR